MDGNQFHSDGKPMPIPKGFDYDMWLGQAPEAPYTPDRCHIKFRYNFDYSGGNLIDLGAHFFDIVQWGNDSELTGPVSIEGNGVFPADPLYNVATDWELRYEYANGGTLIYRSGKNWLRFEGDEGWVEGDGTMVRASSPAIEQTIIGPEEIHLRTCAAGEQRDFLNCVRNGETPFAPADIEHRTASLGHLGNIALQLGRKLRWNPELEVFIDDESANRMLSRPMRAPWRL